MWEMPRDQAVRGCYDAWQDFSRWEASSPLRRIGGLAQAGDENSGRTRGIQSSNIQPDKSA